MLCYNSKSEKSSRATNDNDKAKPPQSANVSFLFKILNPLRANNDKNNVCHSGLDPESMFKYRPQDTLITN